MTRALTRAEIADAFVAACKAELAALKPGNVHIHAAGHRMKVRDFEVSAEAAAPHIANPRLGVGARIRRAVEATIAAVDCNTNLGIVLLAAPLAAAAQRPGFPDLADTLAEVLAGLDRKDAADAFAAIAHANPAGLGKAEKADVGGPAEVTLLEAMALAASRDRIARAYTNGFDDVLGYGVRVLAAARRAGGLPEDAITRLHMMFLATMLDSHIWRKHGRAAARRVKAEANIKLVLSKPPITARGRTGLMALDRDLKAQGLNPGTTADLVVATLFAETIIRLRAAPRAR
jgi:triphosphoribosyl-dephospho-CoA synthase